MPSFPAPKSERPGPPKPPPPAPQKKEPGWLSVALKLVRLNVLKKRLSIFAASVPLSVPVRDSAALPVQPFGSTLLAGPVGVNVIETLPCEPHESTICAVDRSAAAV